jgi:hypothetical protein
MVDSVCTLISHPSGHWNTKDEPKVVGLLSLGFGIVELDRFEPRSTTERC